MAIKESLEENKDFILESLPTEELKQEFLKSLKNAEETAVGSFDEQVSQAQAPEHVTEDMYEAIKKEIEEKPVVSPMSKAEIEAAMEEEVKNVDTTPKDEEGNPVEE